jgi:hypothetical protein
MLTRAVVLLLQGKKALAKMQAGDYDEAAVRTRLENLITTRPVSGFWSWLGTCQGRRCGGWGRCL